MHALLRPITLLALLLAAGCSDNASPIAVVSQSRRTEIGSVIGPQCGASSRAGAPHLRQGAGGSLQCRHRPSRSSAIRAWPIENGTR